MPLFLDVHNLGTPVALNDVANAHDADLQHQDGHDGAPPRRLDAGYARP